MNQQQLINRVVSAAIWQLMRRAPTWLLVVIVGGAFLAALAHGDEYPKGLFEHSPEVDSCDMQHQCYHMDLAHPDKVTPPPAPQYPRPLERPPAPSERSLEPTPLATAPTAPAPSLAPLQELPPPPVAEDVPQSCFNLRRGLFQTPQAAANARSRCERY